MTDVKFAEAMRRCEEQARRRAELQPQVSAHNKQAVLAALGSAGVHRVEVLFDGYGDSGQIESITVTDPAEHSLDGPSGDVEVRQVAHDGSGVTSKLMALPNAIEHICYDLLECHHPGWENNDGGYGDFMFDVAADSIVYTHKSRWTAIDTDLHEL